MKKHCFKCKQDKPISEFYKHPGMADGHLGKCKTCTKTDVRSREVQLSKDPGWCERERERCRIKTAKYHKSHGWSYAKNAKHSRKWCANNKEKRRAQRVARRALKVGDISKPEICQGCKDAPAEEMHHDDYSKPLEIKWLCTKCHGKTRRKTGVKS